jgi:crossover junction endodeoxyribonuclease RuvC
VVILGIDPGSVVTGYGVVEHQNRKSRLMTCGCLRPDAKLPFARRLLEIYDGLLELVSNVAPDEVAVEAVFYGANVQTLMKMCHARGAILLALANSYLPIFEYSPREVKKAVVGRGGASKEQVQFMVQRIFEMDKLPETYDVTDAVAIALCHANRGGLLEGHGGREKNDLEAKLREAGAYDRRPNRLDEKIKAAKLDPKSRRALTRRGGR